MARRADMIDDIRGSILTPTASEPPVRIALFLDDTPIGHRVRRSLVDAGHVVWTVRSGAFSCDTPGVAVADRAALARLTPPDDAFDLLLVASFPWRLSSVWIACAPVALNLHSSLLPRWRGAHPEFWCLAHGDRQTGVTAHHLESSFDTGPIAAQVALDVRADETLGTLCDRLGDAAATLAIALVDDLAVGRTLAATPQPAIDPAEPGARAPAVTDADLELRPSSTDAEIRRRIRACEPYLAPWFWRDGRRWRVADDGPEVTLPAADGGVRVRAVLDDEPVAY
jgi:hypothetical protein